MASLPSPPSQKAEKTYSGSLPNYFKNILKGFRQGREINKSNQEVVKTNTQISKQTTIAAKEYNTQLEKSNRLLRLHTTLLGGAIRRVKQLHSGYQTVKGTGMSALGSITATFGALGGAIATAHMASKQWVGHMRTAAMLGTKKEGFTAFHKALGDRGYTNLQAIPEAVNEALTSTDYSARHRLSAFLGMSPETLKTKHKSGDLFTELLPVLTKKAGQLDLTDPNTITRLQGELGESLAPTVTNWLREAKGLGEFTDDTRRRTKLQDLQEAIAKEKAGFTWQEKINKPIYAPDGKTILGYKDTEETVTKNKFTEYEKINEKTIQAIDQIARTTSDVFLKIAPVITGLAKGIGDLLVALSEAITGNFQPMLKLLGGWITSFGDILYDKIVGALRAILPDWLVGKGSSKTTKEGVGQLSTEGQKLYSQLNIAKGLVERGKTDSKLPYANLPKEKLVELIDKLLSGEMKSGEGGSKFYKNVSYTPGGAMQASPVSFQLSINPFSGPEESFAMTVNGKQPSILNL